MVKELQAFRHLNIFDASGIIDILSRTTIGLIKPDFNWANISIVNEFFLDGKLQARVSKEVETDRDQIIPEANSKRKRFVHHQEHNSRAETDFTWNGKLKPAIQDLYEIRT